MDEKNMLCEFGFTSRKVIKIVLISNIVVEPYFENILYDEFRSDNTHVEFFYINNVELIGESIEEVRRANLIVVLLNFESFYANLYPDFWASKTDESKIIVEEIEKYERLVSLIRKQTNASIIWFGYEDYNFEYSHVLGYTPTLNGIVDQINIALCKAMDGDAVFVDLKKIISKIGASVAYDCRRKYLWNAPYSKALIEAIVKEIHKQFFIDRGITKKCLVIDCDNVLWGGIVSEDGIENLKLSGSGLGRVYQDFQRFVLSLYYHGVIIALCSKNDLIDILTMFREHSEMVLKEEHIACFQINWDDKPSNIKIIAEKLNIGLDSIVFIDDSQIEIEAVKALLPEVTTILFKKNMEYVPFSCFNLKNDINLTNVKRRNETYRLNEKRNEFKREFINYDDYIKSLNVKIKIHRVSPIEYSRVSELTQRTNKCTNGKRFSIQEIKREIESEGSLFYSVHVSDRFSELGLVGVFAVKNNSLFSFSLSCRALGLEIENTMLDYIVSNWEIESTLFYPTGKNDNFKKWLENKLPLLVIDISE